MTDEQRTRYLQIALVVIGLIFTVGLYALIVLWPSAWTWEPRHDEYEHMLLGVYAVLGIFLLIAARDPLKHRSLIRFTAWSSLVHGGIMAVQASIDPLEQDNFFGDIPALLLAALVLMWLMPKKASS